MTIGGAATEIVFALGAGDSVVAVDSSSTHPAVVTELPLVGYVRNLSPEGVLSMDPDLIVATGAVGPPGARRMLERVDLPAVWLPNLSDPGDLKASIRQVGERLGRERAASQLLDRLGAQLDRAAERRSAWTKGPSVLFLLEPPGVGRGGMAGGRDSRADSLIRLAGGRNAAEAFSGFQPVSKESILSMDPAVILIAQSSGHGGGPEAVERILESSVLQGTRAVQRGSVHLVPLDDLAFGPRLGEAALRWNRLVADAAASEDGS